MKRIPKKVIALLIIVTFTFITITPAYAFSNGFDDARKISDIALKVLSSENGNLFEDYTMEDLKYVLAVSPQNAEKIYKHLDEISFSSEDNNTGLTVLQDSVSKSQHSTAKKDLITGEIELVYEDEFYNEDTAKTVEPISLDGNMTFSSSLTRSVDWMEYNPQNWADTRSIFKIWSYYGNSVYSGTAFRIRDKYLGTVAHNLYSESRGGFADEVLCVPAWRAGEPYQPYGNRWSSRLECGADWMLHHDSNDDWGIIHLTSSIDVGSMGRRTWGDTTNHDGETVRIAGYRGDGSAMRLSWGYVTSTGRRRVTANYSSDGGQSGSPITNVDGYIIGIHRDSGPGFIKLDVWIHNKFNSY